MTFPTTLSTLSRSIVLPATRAVYERLARSEHLQLPAPYLSSQETSATYDRRPLAWLVGASWRVDATEVGWLLGIAAEPPQARGKNANARKRAQEKLQRLPSRQQQLRHWAEVVGQMSWSQAQLLQVMEEIEPNIREALFDVLDMAVNALGAYAHLREMLQPLSNKVTARQRLDLTAGIPSPEGSMIDDLMQLEGEQWRQRYAHLSSGNVFELASPRLGEISELPWRPPLSPPPAWNPTQAKHDAAQAEAAVVAATGILQRSKLRRAIRLTRALLEAHASAYDTLARVLAATRLWSLAAADEGLKDGRLQTRDEIFMLELEEIKQLMTGEWHARAQVAPVLAKRGQTESPGDSSRNVARPLGIAGPAITAPARRLQSVDDLASCPPGAIAALPEPTLIWAPLYLQAAGMVCHRGHWLSLCARLGRHGGFPTILAPQEFLDADLQGKIALDPSLNRIEKAN